MNFADLGELVERSTRSAFRLETLPQYVVPEEADAFSAWKVGRPLPLPTPETAPWLAEIAADTKRGYRWYRVHVLDEPLSDYARYEIRAYQAHVAAGVEVWLADRTTHPDLRSLHEDFWLLDDSVAVRMIYDSEGHFLHPELGSSVEEFRRRRDVALRHAEPLDQYVTRRKDLRLTA